MSGLRRWHFLDGSLTGKSHTHSLINSGSLQHPIKFIHMAKYIKAELLWWFSAYEIPFLFTHTLYRLAKEHKNVEVTVKPQITGVPVLMRMQTLKTQLEWEPKQTLTCRLTPQDLQLSLLCPLSGLVSLSAHYTDGNSPFCIAAGNSETLMLSISGT